MSTVPEIIVARHCNMKILALSLVTNNAVLEAGPRGDSMSIQKSSDQALLETMAEGKADHTEVLRAGQEATQDIQVSRKAIGYEYG